MFGRVSFKGGGSAYAWSVVCTGPVDMLDFCAAVTRDGEPLITP
jgi:hypothetical protein